MSLTGSSPLPLAEIGAVAGLVVTVCALAAAAYLYSVRRRYRQQIAALFERLAELEQRLPETRAEDGQDEERPMTGPIPLELAGPPAADAAAVPSADVLAGRTSYVRRVVEGSGGEAESLAGQTIACVHRHLGETLTPADLAEELHISLRTLERGLATTLACTPSQLIVAMKMREARRLLLSGRFRVNEVASRLGFSSPYHFSRRFKEFYGVAPSELARRESAA
jgi:AraC-like DNA-binding protein